MIPATLLLLLACGDPCAPGANPTLEIGLGRDAYEPVSDGDVAPVVQGPQGGYHIELAIETTYMNEKDPGSATATGRIDGELVAAGQPWFQVECDGDVQHATGMRLFVEAVPEDIFGLSLLVEMIAEDSRGKRAEASKTLTVGDVVVQ